MTAATSGPFLEIGLVLLIIAALGRLAAATGLAVLPMPLLVGLLVAGDGPLPGGWRPPDDVLAVATPLAVAVMLFGLGLQFSRADRAAVVRGAIGPGLVDAAANFVPGLAAGLLLGWDVRAALLLGGATWCSSPGVARAVLAARGRLGNRETPAVLSLLVIEHLGVAVFLPVASALLVGGGTARRAGAVAASLAAVAAAGWAAREHGPAMRQAVFGHHGDVALPTLGVLLATVGVLAELRVATAAAAYLVGIVLAGPVTATAPVGDVLGVVHRAATATACFCFGASLGPGAVSAGTLLAAAALAAVTVATKLAAGWWAGRALRVTPGGRWRAGTALAARGELAVALGVLGAVTGVEPDLAPVVAVYVLVTALSGPWLAGRRWIRPRPAAGPAPGRVVR